jgi:hypothetical protein
VFAEHDRDLLNRRARMGLILPSGIATAETTKAFFSSLTESASLVSLYSFFEIRKVFPDTDSRDPFCLITISGSPLGGGFKSDFVFNAKEIEDLQDDNRHFSLSAVDIALINPNTRTCPVFRSKRDA